MDKEKALKFYLYTFGFLNVFLISFTIPLLFRDLLIWSPRNIPNEMMISITYFMMGVVMLLIARKPSSHKAFIDFVVIANIFHAAVMAIFAQNIYHIVIDALLIALMGILPLIFYPWGLKKFLRY